MSRIDTVKETFPDHYEAALKVEDPSGKKHKYLLWIANQLASGHNSPDISQTLKFFDENHDKFTIKDIHKYKDLKDLEDHVKGFGLSNRQAKSQDKDGSDKIYEDDHLMVIRIDDKPAMVLYGANTRWCTTMKDQTYYEDYVDQGNDFYIVIRKNPNSLASSKYAIVRNGLLDFSVYDATDNLARSFSESEEDRLRDAIKAIISDRPPKNYLRLVVNGKIPGPEAAEWLKQQTDVTREYVEEKRPDLRFVYRSVDELIPIFHQPWNRKHLGSIGHERLVIMVEKLKDLKDKENITLKLEILKILKEEDDRLLLAKDSSPQVRAKVVEGVGPEKAREFFADKALAVFRMAARKVEVQFLLDFAAKSKSSRKKKVINEVIAERISQEKVREFILNQPPEVLMELMV
jgi:hypothetical protein